MSFLKKKSRAFRIICCLLAFLLVQNNLEQVQAQPTPFIPPGHNYFVDLSIPYSLPVLRGMRVYPAKPFEFDFVVDSGDRNTLLNQRETSLLVKYFLTCLTIPEEDLWVNLSPYESGKIIPDELALTNAGNTLLEQDKLLKQLASSLTYPESRLGKKFWEKVYKKAYERFGTTDLPVNTYNKVWIVPDKAIVYDMGDSALIGETHLKVMLEEDYLALKKHIVVADRGGRDLHRISSIITKEIILPELEKEINGGKNFAPVRQIFHSMVLAAWFKRALKRNVLSNFYVNKKKISGIDGVDKNAKEEIYKQYLRIYKVGAYNYIREDVDPISQQVVPRKYFSGGFSEGDARQWLYTLQVTGGLNALQPYLDAAQRTGSSYGVAKVVLNPIGGNPDSAQLARSPILRKFTSKFALTVALSLMPLAAGGSASAPAPSPPQTPTAAVHVLKFGENFTSTDREYIQKIREIVHLGDVIALNGQKNPQTGNIYKLDIPYIERNWDDSFKQNHEGRVLEAVIIAFQHKFDLQYEDGRLGPETKNKIDQLTSVRKPAFVPASWVPSRPAPQIAQEPAQQSAHSDERFYAVSQSVAAIPIEDHVVAKSGGIVTGLDPGKKEYKEGEIVFTLQDLELDSNIQELTAELQNRENKWGELKVLFDAQAATDQEVKQAQQQVQEAEQKLAQDREEKADEIVVAPHHLKILDMQVTNGLSVSKGTQLFRYSDRQRVRVDIDVPIQASYFNDINLTLNGDPVQSIFSYHWSPTPSLQKTHLSLIAVPSFPIIPGQAVKVTAKIYSPDKDTQKFYSIAAGQTTLVEVGRVEEYSLSAPAAGAVNFLVHEGDKVKEGQLLARVDVKPYQDELDRIRLEGNTIDVQLNQIAPSAEGTQYAGREQIDNLKIQKFKLMARQQTIQEQISRTEIRSPYNSVIDWSAENIAGVFQNQDVLFHVPGPVFLGDINNARNAILFSRGLKINAGDPVLVQTPDKIRLAAVVTAVNKNPSSPSIQLSQYQSVEVKVFDPQHALRPGLGVQISLIKEIDKQAVLNILSTADNLPQSSSSPPPPPKNPFDGFASQLFTQRTTGLNINLPQAYFLPQAPSLNSTQLEQQVLGNKLLTADQASDYLQKKLSEQLPGAKKFDLTAGAWRSGNGQLSYVGGVQGAFNNIAGQFLSGNAINPTSAALDIIFAFSGKIIDHFDHKIAKEKALAAAVTMTAYYGLQNARFGQVNHANNLLIELGAAQQGEARLEGLRNDLERAREEMLARESGGFTTTGDRLLLEEKISDVQLQVSELERDIQSLTVELNASIGQPRAELRKPISAALPWTGRFVSVSQGQENDWLAILTGDKSPDPRMQEALTARKVMERTMALQRLKKLPAMNFAGVLTPPDSQDGIKNSIFEPLGGETWRVSEMTPGTNLTLGLDIPIYDKQRSTLDKILNVEREKTENKIEKTKLDIAEELAQSVGNIRSLSREINQAEEAYNIACKAWELKAGRPDIYLPHDLVDARMKINQSLGIVLKLKAQYLKEEARLRQMGVLKSGESLVKDQSMVRDQAQLASLPSLLRKLILFLAVAVMPLAAQQGDQPTGSFGGGPADTWTLTHGGSILNKNPLAEMERILINDPNIFTREDALQHFLGEYQDNNETVSSMETVILHSPYQDVVQGLFRFMISRNGTDLRFFIQIINEAEANKNKELIALAYQSLEDVLTNNPDIFKNLTRTNFITSSTYPQASLETAKVVFLTWLAADPVESMAKTRFLQSNYWSPEDLAELYNELNAYADPRIKNLAQLIYDSILWQEARGNIDDTIPLGWYKELNGGIPNLSDSVSRVRIMELREQNRRFLNSARWREMKKYIHPALYAKAEKITQELIANNPASKKTGAPLYYISFSGEPVPNIYFNMLDLSGQRKYVEESGISELARMLDSSIYDREFILNRLMASRDGRLLVLKVYNETDNSGLLKLIERFNWPGIIKTDAKDNESSAADHIFRRALAKMYQQTHNGSFLDVLLEVYSSLEMSSVQAINDPRGDALRIAEINRRAAAWALESVDESWKHRQAWSLWRGFDVRQKEELDLQIRIKDELDNEDNPEQLGKYLDEQQAKAANSQSRGMFKDLMSIKHQFADDVEKNDQSIPHLPVYLVLYMSGLSAFLGFLASIVFNVRGWFRHRNDTNKESKRVREKLLGNGKNGNNGHNGNNGNHGDKAMLSSPIEREIPKPAFDSLQTWRNRVVDWSKQNTFAADGMLSDFNLILNCAAEVLRTMPYSPDLIWSEKKPKNEDFRATLDYFFVLADDTLAILEERLQHADLNETQRQQFILDKDAMVEKMKYAVPYLVVLKYRSTIEKVMGYKFADGDWKENFYWLARWYLYYEPLIITSNKELRSRLPGLLDQGDLLMPGLYKDRDVIEAQSNEKLNDVITQGKTAYNPQSRPERIAYKERSFQSRMLSLVGPALFIFSGAAGLAGFSAVGVESLIASVFIMALTIYVFWKPHKEALRMEMYDTMKWLIDQRNSRLNHLLDPSGEYTKDDRSTEQRIVDLAKQEGLNEAVGELDLNNPPRVDAIVIISEDEKNVGVLKKHVAEIRGEVIRKDIPVEVISPRYKGSANAYYEALLMMKKNFEARHGQYSNVNPWKDARVAYIFHGREAIQDSTLIDWSIINAYRAAASMSKLVPAKEGGRSGGIVIFSRDFYAGPIQQVPGSDTTILTSRVNGDALNKLGWVSTSFSENGDSEVDEVLEKVNIKDLLEKDKKNPRGSNTVKYFRLKRYDLYNTVLKQFSAFSGIILMGPDAVAEDGRIAERLQDSGLMELLAAHLTSDIIIPKLIARNPDDNGFNRKVNDYVEERSGWPDFIAAEDSLEASNLGFKGIRADLVRLSKAITSAVNPHTRLEEVLPDLKTLYNLIGRVVNPNSKLKELYTIIRKEAKPDSKIHAYVPHGDVYMPNIRDVPSFKKVQSLLGVKQDAAMSAAAKGPGGIDLNFQPQFIQRSFPTGSAGIQDANMADGFKGFNFNIVRFTSQLTVNGAFQLMFT